MSCDVMSCGGIVTSCVVGWRDVIDFYSRLHHHSTPGISSDDPDSLASSRLKQRAEKKKSKLNRVQEMVANKARLEESNLEKDMEIEGECVTDDDTDSLTESLPLLVLMPFRLGECD